MVSFKWRLFRKPMPPLRGLDTTGSARQTALDGEPMEHEPTHHQGDMPSRRSAIACLRGNIPVDKPAGLPYTRAGLPFCDASHLGLRLADMGAHANDHPGLDLSRRPPAMPGLSSRARFLLRPQLLTRVQRLPDVFRRKVRAIAVARQPVSPRPPRGGLGGHGLMITAMTRSA
jgi:hypothetical protein